MGRRERHKLTETRGRIILIQEGKLTALIMSLLIAVAAQAAASGAQSLNDIRQRAEQGDPQAQFELGVRYRQGRDVAADSSAAVEGFRKAAAQSNADAVVALATMYGSGRGVEKDLSRSVFWFRSAAELGHASAQFNLGGLYARGEGVTQDYIEAYKWQSLAITRAADRPDVPTFTASRDALARQLTVEQIAEANARIRQWDEEFAKRQGMPRILTTRCVPPALALNRTHPETRRCE